MRLLFVCTGNMCRSPVAERLATAWAHRALGPGAGLVDVSSAGLEAPTEREIDALSARALSRLGGDAAGFVSRQWTPRMSEDADLVITMTRRQRRALLERSPRTLRRTYTLLEASDLLATCEGAALDAVALPYRASHLARLLDAGRPRRRVSGADDIPDPIGRTATVHESVATQIADALRPLAVALFGAAPTEAGPVPSSRTEAMVTHRESLPRSTWGDHRSR